MPNEQNLIPMDQRSQSEARELGREGGRASGASRRRKRSLREAADLYLSLPVADKRAWNKLARDGVEPEDVDNQMAVIAGLTLKAAKGDAKADAKTTENKSRNEKDTSVAEPVYLQTGSYQNPADADNQKARLAMMGAEATIQQVMLNDKVWYRVRLGPFRKMDELSSMRSELAKQGIEANVIKKD